jgi:hypothetical protein
MVAAEKPESRQNKKHYIMKKSIYSVLLAGMVLLVCMSSCKKDKVTGTVSGVIIDSQTGEGMAGVTVSLTDDMSATNGDNATAAAITDGYGDFTIENVEIGTYRMIIEADGYFIRIVSDIEVIEGENYLDQQTIVEAPESGSFRIILIWGESPYDLDSHLTGPSSDGSRFHIYFGNKYNTDQTVDLDVDDTYSYGPETTTILSFLNGTYRYSVHNYSDQTSTGGVGIYNSPARVEVYDASGLVETFDAPVFNGSANTWRVFEILVSGTSTTIHPINEYVTANYYIADDFKSTGVKPAMDIAGF